jgi:hypothetical protein
MDIVTKKVEHLTLEEQESSDELNGMKIFSNFTFKASTTSMDMERNLDRNRFQDMKIKEGSKKIKKWARRIYYFE